MDDVTHLFITYRECVRHLWNTYFCSVADPSQNWDLRDEFDSIARSIFSSLVLRPLDLFDHELRLSIPPIHQRYLAFALCLLLSTARRYSLIAICRGAATGTTRCRESSLTKSS